MTILFGNQHINVWNNVGHLLLNVHKLWKILVLGRQKFNVVDECGLKVRIIST